MNSFENYINQFAPANRKIADDIAFGIDFDATLVDNDKINLEIDFATVNAVIAVWSGEKIASTRPEDLQIYEKAKVLLPEADEAAKARLRAVLAEPEVMRGHLPDCSNGAWPKNQDEYNKAMAGKPINALLSYINKRAEIFPADKAFSEMIEDDIVEDIEVAGINEIVPLKVTEPFPFWPEALDNFAKAGIDCAIVTSSEYSRVMPLLKSTGVGAKFGFTDKDYAKFDMYMAKRKIARQEWRLAVKKLGRDNPETIAAEKRLDALKDDFHRYVKENTALHLYSAAEEVDDAKRHGREVFNRKAHGDIYGVFVAAETQKRGKNYGSGILIEDSGSIGCIKQGEEIHKYSSGLFGSDKGEANVNGFDLAIGLVAASHYTDKGKQAETLLAKGAHKIAFNIKDVMDFVLEQQKLAAVEKDTGLTGKDNRQALASALAKYGNSIAK